MLILSAGVLSCTFLSSCCIAIKNCCSGKLLCGEKEGGKGGGKENEKEGRRKGEGREEERRRSFAKVKGENNQKHFPCSLRGGSRAEEGGKEKEGQQQQQQQRKELVENLSLSSPEGKMVAPVRGNRTPACPHAPRFEV